jgi:hypothetical protein
VAPLMFVVAGVLVGGVWSLSKQGASKVLLGIMLGAAALALAAGILWL